MTSAPASPRFRSRTAVRQRRRQGLYVVPGTICLLDQDYTRFVGGKPAGAEFIFTDRNDLEGMLFHSPALRRVLLEMGSPKKLVAVRDAGGTPEDIIVNAVCDLGVLRLLSGRMAQCSCHEL
jgi:hypothetical protein